MLTSQTLSISETFHTERDIFISLTMLTLHNTLLDCQLTRSVPEVRGRFQSRLRNLYYLCHWRLQNCNSTRAEKGVWLGLLININIKGVTLIIM